MKRLDGYMDMADTKEDKGDPHTPPPPPNQVP